MMDELSKLRLAGQEKVSLKAISKQPNLKLVVHNSYVWPLQDVHQLYWRMQVSQTNNKSPLSGVLGS
jgi:hypothetical protein